MLGVKDANDLQALVLPDDVCAGDDFADFAGLLCDGW